MRCDWASRARRHDCFKVSKVGWLGHTKLTFGRRVPSRPPRAIATKCGFQRGESAIGRRLAALPAEFACRRPKRHKLCLHVLFRIAHAECRPLASPVIPVGTVASNLPEFCGFPPLPDAAVADVVSTGAESEGTEPKPPEAHDVTAPTQSWCSSGPTHCRREGPKPVVRTLARGKGDARRLLTARRSGNESKREYWRACDEGLHYWTGREDL